MYQDHYAIWPTDHDPTFVSLVPVIYYWIYIFPSPIIIDVICSAVQENYITMCVFEGYEIQACSCLYRGILLTIYMRKTSEKRRISMKNYCYSTDIKHGEKLSSSPRVIKTYCTSKTRGGKLIYSIIQLKTSVVKVK